MTCQLRLKLRPVLLNDLVKQRRLRPVAYIDSCGVLLCQVSIMRRQSHCSNKYRKYSLVVLQGTMAEILNRCGAVALKYVRFFTRKKNPNLESQIGVFELMPGSRLHGCRWIMKRRTRGSDHQCLSNPVDKRIQQIKITLHRVRVHWEVSKKKPRPKGRGFFV